MSNRMDSSETPKNNYFEELQNISDEVTLRSVKFNELKENLKNVENQLYSRKRILLSVHQEILSVMMQLTSSSEHTRGVVAYTYSAGNSKSVRCHFSPEFERGEEMFILDDYWYLVGKLDATTPLCDAIKEILKQKKIIIARGRDAWVDEDFLGIPFFENQEEGDKDKIKDVAGVVGIWGNFGDLPPDELRAMCELICSSFGAHKEFMSNLKSKQKELGKSDKIERERRLLKAITHVQTQFMMEKFDRYELFMILLNELLTLTESEYGFIGEILYSAEKKPFCSTWACTEISWNGPTRKWFKDGVKAGLRVYKIDSLYGPVMCGQVVIANNVADDPRATGRPRGHPPLDTFLGLPIKCHDEVVGMCALANREGGYTQEFVDFLQPFLVTYSTMIKSFRTNEDRKRLEQELRREKEKAEELSKIKSHILANTSHELKTPLNAICGITDLLLTTENLSEELYSCLNAIKSSSDSLLFTLNQLLDFSRLNANKFVETKQEFSITETLEKVGDMLIYSAYEKGLGLIIDIDTSIPKLVGDSMQLRGILLNLGSNAIKFTNKGHVLITAKLLEIDTQQNIAKACLEVKDTGIGVSEEDQQLLFSPFTQLDISSTRKQGGTGLGLCITKEVVNRLGGTITLSSEVELGTTVRVILPFGFCSSTTISNQHFQKFPSSLNVMIVTKTDALAKVIENHLCKWGCYVYHATSLKEACNLLDSLVPSVQLAFVDGDEYSENLQLFFNTLQTRIKSVKMVVMKTVLTPGEVEKMNNFGYKFFISKPLKQTKLYDISKSLLFESGVVPEDTSSKPLVQQDIISQFTFKNQQPIAGKSMPTVLVVDDNGVNRNMLAKMLQKFGCNVECAVDGNEAVKMTLEGSYSIIFMDLQMPICDGYEATIRIRKTLKSVPIIAVTANTKEVEMPKCVDAGMNDFLTKPIQLSQVKFFLNKFHIMAQ